MGSHFLLQGIFPTQGSNPGLLHCRQILYRLRPLGSSIYLYGVQAAHRGIRCGRHYHWHRRRLELKRGNVKSSQLGNQREEDAAINLKCSELALGCDFFQLSPGPHVMQVWSDIFWEGSKERVYKTKDDAVRNTQGEAKVGVLEHSLGGGPQPGALQCVCGISGGGVCPRVCLGHFLDSRPLLLPGPRLPHLKHATVDGTNPQVSFIPVYK